MFFFSICGDTACKVGLRAGMPFLENGPNHVIFLNLCPVGAENEMEEEIGSGSGTAVEIEMIEVDERDTRRKGGGKVSARGSKVEVII